MQAACFQTMYRRLGAVLAVALAMVSMTAHAQSDRDARRELAQQVPIADVHMHLYPGLQPAAQLAAMERNNVRWGGAVGPINGMVQPAPFVEALGERYVPAGAQPFITRAWRGGGKAAMVDLEAGPIKQMLASVRSDFEAGRIRGVGELILNNAHTHSDPTFRRKVPIDAPPYRALFAMAAEFKGFAQVHMEDDSDSIEQLLGLVAAYPSVPVILSHCMGRSSPGGARELLMKSANLYCETSARSSALHAGNSYNIHTERGASSGWVALMEEMPDRFMVGSDITDGAVSYDTVIGALRTGLLPELSPATQRKVAYENAQRVLGLGPLKP